MTVKKQKEHMIAEENALDLSKKIYCITKDTDRSTFKAEAKAKQLKLEVHPDKSNTFCVKQKLHLCTMW
jgi:hypothetical protein